MLLGVPGIVIPGLLPFGVIRRPMTLRVNAALEPHTGVPEGEDAKDSVEAIIGLHEDDLGSRVPLQHIVDRASDLAGRPSFVFILIAAISVWLVYNILAGKQGGGLMLDAPPFAWLELVLTLVALLLAAVIVATQRREDRLAERRAQLTLQLALLSEKKNAKIIALLEELRRDSPALKNRIDPESEKMAAPVDPAKILDKLDCSIEPHRT